MKQQRDWLSFASQNPGRPPRVPAFASQVQSNMRGTLEVALQKRKTIGARRLG